MDFSVPSKSQNCLINLSSSHDSIASGSEEKKKDAKKDDSIQMNFSKLPEDFPQSELWWPLNGENNNEEWGLPSNESRNESDLNYNKIKTRSRRNVDNGQDKRVTGKCPDEWMKEEVLEAASLLNKAKKNEDNLEEHMEYDQKMDAARNEKISFTRRIVFRDDPTNKFTTLQLGKKVIERAHVVPKSIKLRIFVNCQPNQHEIFNDETSESNVKDSDQLDTGNHETGEEKWSFYERITRFVKPLEPRKFSTFSYEVVYEHTYYVPTDAPPIDFCFGTLKDPQQDVTKYG